MGGWKGAWLVVHRLAEKQARVLFFSRQGIPLRCFLLNSQEKNQETSAVISKCQNAGKS
jgi:hypothetical protein